MADKIDDFLMERAEKFKNELTAMLFELDFLDPIAGRNKIEALVAQLMKELHGFRINGKLETFQNPRYAYLFGRMNKKNQTRKRIKQLIRAYWNDRWLIVNRR